MAIWQYDLVINNFEKNKQPVVSMISAVMGPETKKLMWGISTGDCVEIELKDNGELDEIYVRIDTRKDMRKMIKLVSEVVHFTGATLYDNEDKLIEFANENLQLKIMAVISMRLEKIMGVAE